MYHITITNLKNGKVVADNDTNVFAVVAKTEHEGDTGMLCSCGIEEGSITDSMELILGMQSLQKSLTKDNPLLGIMLSMKDEIIADTETIDLIDTIKNKEE